MPTKKKTKAHPDKSAARVQTLLTPATLEEARREIIRMICGSCIEITDFVIREAKKGKYLSAKFLFDVAGLSADAVAVPVRLAEDQSLARLLLRHWRLEDGNAIVEDATNETAPTAEKAAVSVE